MNLAAGGHAPRRLRRDRRCSELRHGEKLDGALSLVKGGAGIGGGLATLGAPGGVAGMAAAAPILGIAGARGVFDAMLASIESIPAPAVAQRAANPFAHWAD